MTGVLVVTPGTVVVTDEMVCDPVTSEVATIELEPLTCELVAMVEVAGDNGVVGRTPFETWP